MKNKINTDPVSRQTLIWAIVVSLAVGFFGGSIFTSFKLTSKKPGSEQQVMSQNSQSQADRDQADHIASHIFQLEQLVKENPEDADSWKKLGDFFYDADRYADSIHAYNQYLKFVSDNILVITDLGTMHRLNQQPEKAIQMYDKAIRIDPKFEQARFNKGLVLLHDLKNTTAAIKEWEALLAINPLVTSSSGESLDSMVQRLKKENN